MTREKKFDSVAKSSAIAVLEDELKIRSDVYAEYIAHGGKTDCGEEFYLDTLNMAIAALREQSNATQRVANTDNALTNAQHIRSMSDEELAKWLADMWDCSYCSEYDRTGGHPLFSAEPCDQKCEQHCFDWLKQPYGGK